MDRPPASRGRLLSKDRELVAGSLAHYEDPEYYTSTYRRRLDDVQYYVGLAQKHGGPVLEYGAGNGRIALPIARHGVKVTGVDHSPAMVTDFRARLRDESQEVRARVRIVKGDMRRLRLHSKFRLVLSTFNTALHLYERRDVEDFLARVREHLSPGGLFVADLSMPSLADLMRDPTRSYKAPRFRHPSAGLVRYEEHFDYDPVRQILFVAMEFHPQDRGKESFMTPLAHRQFFPREWDALLAYNGFRVEQVFGDFHGGPLDRGSDVMVWHARRSRGKRRGRP